MIPGFCFLLHNANNKKLFINCFLVSKIIIRLPKTMASRCHQTQTENRTTERSHARSENLWGGGKGKERGGGEQKESWFKNH